MGSLRYQPQPLDLPEGIRPERRGRYFPPLAIAAAIALMMLAAGLWIRIHRSQTPRRGEMATGQPLGTGEKQTSAVTSASPIQVPPNQHLEDIGDKGAAEKAIHSGNRKLASPRNFLARNPKRGRDLAPPFDLTAEQRDQALAAKEQLMLALRVASAKLNLAQRKTQGSSQGAPTPSTIRNQHKVG